MLNYSFNMKTNLDVDFKYSQHCQDKPNHINYCR